MNPNTCQVPTVCQKIVLSGDLVLGSQGQNVRFNFHQEKSIDSLDQKLGVKGIGLFIYCFFLKFLLVYINLTP